ncbi:MAG: alpha amylase C-terminal domain-containing protein, partial [Deltaproteobacteria bacterium]|nr:alpha amylase C-terminal domain-containing protein [Deltaproteobacteria bacterium]
IASALNGDGDFLYGTYLTRYFELHDEVLASTGGSRAVNWIDTTAPHDDMWAKGRTKLAQGLTLFVPGIPAMFMGSEWLEDANLCAGDSNGSCRIDWSRNATYAHIVQYYHDAIAVRKANGCFRSNAGWQVSHVNDGGNVLAFQRWDGSGNVCLVVANFSNNDYYGYRLGFPQSGCWQTVLNSQSSFYDGDNVGNSAITTEGTAWDGFAQSALVDLPQMGLMVYKWGTPPPPPCPADLDGNHIVDLSDLSIQLAHYGQAGTAASGDLTGDGFVDLSDLAIMLAAYGTNCP